MRSRVGGADQEIRPYDVITLTRRHGRVWQAKRPVGADPLVRPACWGGAVKAGPMADCERRASCGRLPDGGRGIPMHRGSIATVIAGRRAIHRVRPLTAGDGTR